MSSRWLPIRIAVICLLFGCSGCGSAVPMYPGPRLKPGEVARVTTQPGVIVTRIDPSEMTLMSGAYLELLPGSYTFTLTYNDGRRFSKDYTLEVSEKLEAGKRYVIESGSNGWEWHPFILER